MIFINSDHLNRTVDYGVFESDFPVIELEGRHEFDILCPVSVVTGHRTSLQQAILHLTQDNADLANNLIENLDPSYSDERLPVSDRLDLIRQRLSSGSFAEDDHYLDALGEFIKLNYPEKGVTVDTVVSTSKEVGSDVVDQND